MNSENLFFDNYFFYNFKIEIKKKKTIADLISYGKPDSKANLRLRNLELNICLLFALISVCASCKKFVEIPPPTNQLVTASVFASNSTATSAQTAIYTQMQANGDLYNISFFTGLSSDELVNYSFDIGVAGYYLNALNPMIEQASDIWTPAYSYIYQANAIIAALKGNQSLNSEVNKQLTGESEFIRAFWYFYLANIFGDVPLITSTDYSKNAIAFRTSQSKVYQQIISDLIDAQKLLSDNYIDASDTVITNERTRPTRWAATALLARVYLFIGDYENAKSQANSIIANSSMFSLVTDLNAVFLKNSKEAIWQLQPVFSGYNTSEGANFILTDVPQGYLTNCSTLSSQLINSFEQGDKRRANWVDSISIDTNTYFFPYKYKIQFNSSITEYSMVFRLAEQYLIRAEANAQGTDIIGAKTDLNVIRNRAGLSNTQATTKEELLNAILHERQIELFSETGNRWLDLKRTNMVDSVMNVVTPFKGGIWISSAQLFPIPQSERNNGPNLSQNPGY